MAKESDVYVRLKLDSKDFNKNMDKSKKSVKGFIDEGEKADKTVKSMTVSMSAFGAVALVAVGAIGKINADMAKLIEQTDRYSRSTGIATNDLLAMNLAMKSLGIDADTANEGLKTFAENIGEAIVSNTGPAKESLDALGISLESLQGLSTDEQLIIFAGALSKVETEAERTFLAIQAGGEDFDRMNKLWEIGEQELTQLVNANKQFTNSLDLDKIRSTADEMNNLNKEWTKFSLGLTTASAPALQATIKQFNELGDGMSHLIDLYAEWEARGFNGGLFSSLDEIDNSGATTADNLQRRINAINEATKQEQLYKDELKKEQELLLKNNKLNELSIKQLEAQANIVRGIAEQESKERAVSLEVLEQREKILDEENQSESAGGSFGGLSSPRLQGLLERGSQSEASVRGGEINQIQKEQLATEKQILKELEKANRGRQNIRNVSI